MEHAGVSYEDQAGIRMDIFKELPLFKIDRPCQIQRMVKIRDINGCFVVQRRLDRLAVNGTGFIFPLDS